MKEAIKNEEVEEFGLDDLIEAEERESKEKLAEEEKPDDDELEKARAFAEKINMVFLFGVNKAVCPSVETIDDVIDREAGNEALLPLALSMGGTTPEWMIEFMAKYDPYIKAGVYMGMTVYTASKIEKALKEQAEKEPEKDSDNGEK